MKEIKMTMETQPKVLNMTMETGKGGGGVTSYNALTDKPSINGVTLIGNLEIDIPDKTSDLLNDSGFITERDIPAIPSKTSELTNDSGYITNDDIPTVPTKVSELENDSNFVTEDAIPTKVSQLENDAQYVKAEDIPEGATISTDTGNILKKGTDNGLYVPPTDLKDYAKKTDLPFVPEDVSAFNNDAGYITEASVPTKVSQLSNDSGFITSADIPDVSIYALTTEAGYDLGLSMDSKTYEMTIELKNKAGTVISTKKLDFPIESMVVNASYKDGKLTLTLQSGSTIDVDISAIVGGLVNDTFTIAGIDMKDDITANELKTALGVVDAYTKTETDNLLNGKADSSAIPDISGKADTSYVNTELGKKVDKVTGKGLSTNDFTNTYKSAIDNLPSSYAPTNAEKNVIIGVQKNGADLTVDANRKVNVTVPTQLSDLTADATHRLVSDTEKSTWSGKQNALNTTQMSAVNSGITADKVTSYDSTVTEVETINTNLSQLEDDVSVIDVNNLIPFPYYNNSGYQAGNIVFDYDNDGIVTTHNTATAEGYFRILNLNTDILKDLEVGEKYTLIGCPKDGSTSTYMLNIYVTDGSSNIVSGADVGNGYTFTMPNGATGISIGIRIKNLIDAEGLVFKPMIIKGTLPHSFTPYNQNREVLANNITEIKSDLSQYNAIGRSLELDTEVGGIVVNEIVGNSEQGENPSPTNPQPIHSSGDDGGITIEVVGKNLFNMSSNTSTVDGVTFRNNGNGTYTLSGTATKEVWFQIGGYMPISDYVGKDLSFAGSNGKASLRYYYRATQSTSSIGSVRNDTKVATVSTVPSGANYITLSIYVPNGTSFNNDIVKPMISEILNDSYDNFEPYTHKSIFIPLSEPLRSVGDKHDRIVKIDGKWKVERNIIAFDLGDLTWSAQSTNTTGKYRMRSTNTEVTNYIVPVSANTEAPLILCTKYMATTSNAGGTYGCHEGVSLEAGTSNLFIYDESYSSNTSANAFKEANKGVFINFALKTPVYEEITDQTALYLLESYADKTYISTADGLAELNVNYGKSDAISLGLMGYNAFRLFESKQE